MPTVPTKAITTPSLQHHRPPLSARLYRPVLRLDAMTPALAAPARSTSSATAKAWLRWKNVLENVPQMRGVFVSGDAGTQNGPALAHGFEVQTGIHYVPPLSPILLLHMRTILGTDVTHAASLLRAGEIVAVPTETVYGL